MSSPTNESLLTAQVSMALFAVEALIATHPKPEEVRRVFDEIFGQFQVGIISTGSSIEASNLLRQIADKVFTSAYKP
jgi:ribosomal protein L17